jgi:hypothetical protein
MTSLLRIITLLAFIAGAAYADDTTTHNELYGALKVKLRTVQHMALNPVLVGAVLEQNQEDLSLDVIKERDKDWKSSEELTDMKRQLMGNRAAELLRDTVGDGATFTEAFLTDNKGANVAVFPPTSDYWQGDEEKWTASWAEGHGEMFIGPLEYDKSTDQYAVQISAPVKDGTDTIGVLVVGVSVDYVSGRQ